MIGEAEHFVALAKKDHGRRAFATLEAREDAIDLRGAEPFVVLYARHEEEPELAREIERRLRQAQT